MRRALLVFVLLALLAALVVGAAWVIATPAGLQWAYAQLRERLPGTLEIESLEGRLIGPLELRNLRYRSEATAARVAHARLEWAPLALLAGRLEIDALQARGVHVALPERAEAPPADEPFQLALPFEVSARNIELEDIRITRAGGAPYRIRTFELTLDVDGELARVERLRVEAQNFALRAEGALGLEAGAEGTLTTRWRVELPGQPALAGGGEIAGNLARLQIDQRVTAPVDASVHARVNGLPDALAWQAEVEIPELDTRTLGLDGPAAQASLALSAKGDRETFQASGTLRADLAELPPVAGRFSVNGALDGPIVLERLVLQPADTATQVTVQGRWQPDDARWQAQIAWERVQWPLTGEAVIRSPGGTLAAAGTLARYDLTLEATITREDLPPLHWRAQGNGDRRHVSLDSLRVEAEGAAVEGSLRAEWSPEIAWQTQLQWQALRWPFTGDALLTSPAGTLTASGNLEQYRLTLDATTLAENLPRVRWRAAGSGDREHVMFDEVVLETLDTTLHGDLRAAWSPQLAWQARLRGQDINPAVAWPEWPGSLALNARASGGAEELRVRLEQLRGTLRRYDFAASAVAVRRGDNYPELALELRSGGATASVRGRLRERWDLSWRVRAGELGNLLPQAAGSLTGTGRITGARASPRIEAQVSAADLAYRDTRIAQLSLDGSIDLSDRAPSQVALQAAQGALLGRPFEHVALEAAGYLKDHGLTLAATFADVALRARATGGYRDTIWRGELQRSTLRVAGETWTLAGTPRLVAGPERVMLEEACWRADSARVCAALEHAPAAATTMAVAAERLPLALFGPLLPAPLGLQGTLSGSGQARLDAGRVQAAEARFDLSAGSLSLPAPAATVIAYEGASLDAVVDTDGLRANATLALPHGGGGRAHVELPRFHAADNLGRQPVDGRIVFTMQDLAPLAAVLPRLEELRGRLEVDLALAGTLADPRLRGSVTLVNAAARIPASGIQVHDIRITATASGGDTIEISGEAHSGGGQLAVAGRVTFPGEPAWRAELQIAGAQFQAVDLGKTRVYISPDLRARIVPGKVRVTGSVRIPQATLTFITPEQRAVVPPSPDVVIVNAPAQAPAPPELWQVTAEIRVILGDQVTFTGFGLNAAITGEVTLVDAPGQATTARGELRVAQGQYEAYGQKLEIERGRLTFVGGPVSNPGIDARAVRRLDQVTAGVEVGGTLQSPQLTLFSDPAMGQADALSYLLFGRPLSGASSAEGKSLAAAARALQLAGGERLARRIGRRFGFEEVEIETGSRQETAALVLGRRLSPRLYINYSIGLFEPSSVLRLRYQLTPSWSLEAQSGTSSGGDLLYTLER